MERKQAAPGIPENFGIDFAGAHGHVDVAVLCRLVDRDNELAGVEFEILVAGHVVHVHFAGKNARGEDRNFSARG